MLPVFSRIVHLQGLPTLPEVIVTSTMNIMKGSEIVVMKELQPSVIQSCCRGDRHRNNQVDIKSKATTEYLRVLIYYKGMRTDQCTDHVCTCVVIQRADMES